MEATCRAGIIRIKGCEKQRLEDTLIVESRLDIWLNGKKLIGLIATPIDLEALVVGYLVSEQIISSYGEIIGIDYSGEGIIHMDVTAENVDSGSIERLGTEAVMISGCGKGHTANIDPEKMAAVVNHSSYCIEASQISAAMEGFMDHCKLYTQTGAVHTAQLIFEDGSYLVAEDLAQHNTIDKVMGKACMGGKDVGRALLLLSGRLSSEMVAKAVMHGVPIVASRTSATCLGVKIGKKFGVTLAGFVRGDKMNLYSVPERILVS